MKQILQNLQNGTTEVVEAPSPRAGAGQLLIRTTRSLISAGTERMLVDFGKAGLIDKARQQPEKVKMVLDKVRTDGLLTTVDAVRAKLGQPIPLGYCNAGVVVEVGTRDPGPGAGRRAGRGLRWEIGWCPTGPMRIWCGCPLTCARAFRTEWMTSRRPLPCWRPSACRACAWPSRRRANALS